MEVKNSKKIGGILVVKDAANIIGLYVLSVLTLFLAPIFLAVLLLYLVGDLGFFVGAILGVGASVFIFLIALAQMRGYVIDTNEGTLEFAAIGDPDGPLDYFNPTFYKKLISRRKIKLGEIIEMSRSEKGTVYENGSVKYSYQLELKGDFGSIPLKFAIEGKRDQLASYIRSINNMGAPVLIVE